MAVVRSLIFTTILGLLLFYIWRRLVRATGLRGRARIAATAGLVALVLPMIIVNLVRGGGPPKIDGVIAWPAFIGWALFGFLFFGVLVSDIARLVVWLGRRATRSPPMDPSRRQALARITGGVVGTAVVSHVGYGMVRALGEAELVDVPITLAKLPKALDGFTIVQLSDLHVGGAIDRAFVELVVDRANRLSPDLVALTGDIVDGPVGALKDRVAPFAQLRAAHGVYAVTGNHEYYAGADGWIDAISSHSVRYLRNQLVTIGGGSASFQLAGVDDHESRRYRGHGEDMKAATAERDPDRALVLLAHQPRQVFRAARHGVDLQLSGHTHGGQIWPWHYIVKVQQKGMLAGRYLHQATQLYVTRGCGYWGPPVRLLAPLEITRVILRSA